MKLCCFLLLFFFVLRSSCVHFQIIIGITRRVISRSTNMNNSALISDKFEKLAGSKVSASAKSELHEICFIVVKQLEQLSTTGATESTSLIEERQVFVRLVDCMQCRVRVPRCSVEHIHLASLEQQDCDQSEDEGGLVPLSQQNQPVPDLSQATTTGNDELLFFRAIEFEDCNFFEDYIFIDSPWPPTSD